MATLRPSRQGSAVAVLQRSILCCTFLAVLTWATLWSFGWPLPHPGWALTSAVGPPLLLLTAQFAALACVDRPGGRSNGRARLRHLLPVMVKEVATAARVFCWRQPFRWAQYPDYAPESDSQRIGVVLIHGYLCNRGLWTPWLQRLHGLGTPHVALNLEPIFGSIDDYAPIIDRAVEDLRALTGRAPVIVAHSMGGLAVRAWLRWRLTKSAVAETGTSRGSMNQAPASYVITLGTPHHGTWLARLGTTRNAREMRQHSRWLAALQRDEASIAASLPPIISFYGDSDNIVFPVTSAALECAENHRLRRCAHLMLVEHPAPWARVRKLLDPGQ